MHPDKSKIVYCKDVSDAKETVRTSQFDFLRLYIQSEEMPTQSLE